ncbi:MAG: DUF5906 domain-containing protein [bacterium]|nr:DUF5906 domain-containing protein [bacterium]
MKLYELKSKLSSVYDNILKNTPHKLDKQTKSDVVKHHSKGKDPFQTIDLLWTQASLDQHTCGPCLISPHIYKDGIRDKANWLSCQILAFDFDNKEGQEVTTVDGLRLRLREGAFWKDRKPTYYLHHSRGHDPNTNKHKFHAFFLLDREVTDPQQFDLIYNYLQDTHFAGSDNIGDRARCILPGRLDFPTVFQEGQPLKVDDLLNLAHQALLETQAKRIVRDLATVKVNNNKLGKTTKPVYLPKATLVEFEDGRVASLGSLHPEDAERFLCPCCGKDPHRGNPGKANATFQLNPQGLPIVFCSSCKANSSGGTSLQGVYNITKNDTWLFVRDRLRIQYADYFYLEDKLARVTIQQDVEPYSVSIGKVCPRAIDELPQIREPLLGELAREAHTISQLRFNQEGNPDIDTPDYLWKGDVLIGRNPALRAGKEDNAFIDAWLVQLFGPHTTFIKQWLAMYCYTNYIPLPVLILYSKERGTGKNVFAEAVCSIYEPLHSRDTDYEHFTEAFKGKLWYIDEQSTDGKKLYQAVKQIGGNNKLVVNNKYGLKHQVDRNLSVILTTNNLKPMEMEADELQLDETNNQFFVMELKPLPTRTRNFPDLVKERLGHYVRTELQAVFTALQQDPDYGKYRYGIRVPVTDEERRLYNLSQTVVEREALDLWECLKEGHYIKADPRFGDLCTVGSISYRTKGQEVHVQPSTLRTMVKQMGLSSTSNQVIAYLQQKGKLGLEEVRDKGKRLGYQLMLTAQEAQDLVAVLRFQTVTDDR